MSYSQYRERQQTPKGIGTDASCPSSIQTTISPNSQYSTLLKVEVKPPPKPVLLSRSLSNDQGSKPSGETHLLTDRSNEALRKWVVATQQTQLKKVNPSAAHAARSRLQYLPLEILVHVIHQLRLSDLVALSVASAHIGAIISAPALRLLNTEAVMYWFWGPKDFRVQFRDSERNRIRFSPDKKELKKMLDHLWMRDQISDGLYEHFVSGIESSPPKPQLVQWKPQTWLQTVMNV